MAERRPASPAAALAPIAARSGPARSLRHTAGPGSVSREWLAVSIDRGCMGDISPQ